ncbi:hypothetical protein [Vibrio phage JSF4]|nr:hypothetical protein [Vibrio phage JSF4]
MKWFLRLILSREEMKEIEMFKQKATEMAKYSGRVVISDSGGIRDEFETEEGRAQYYRAIIKRVMREDKIL